MMDNFELKPEPKVKRKSVIWNILTILVLLVACYLAYYFFTIFINPNSPYNPFPPVPSQPSPNLHFHTHHHPPTGHLDTHSNHIPGTNPYKSPHLDFSAVSDHSKPHHNANSHPHRWNADNHPNRHAGLGGHFLCSQYQNACRFGLQLDGCGRHSNECRQSTSALSDCPVGR